MNVLILHQHFNTPQSGGALRSYFLAKAAVDRGWHVSVITGYSGKIYRQEKIEDIDVHSLPVLYSNYFGFWKRIWSFTGYVIGCIRLAKKFQQADMCYAISTPLTVGWAARWLKWRYGIPYIFEVGDLWPDAPIELEVITNSVLKKFLWSMEKKIYREAKSVVALSPDIQSAIEKKTPRVKVHMISNMADTEFFKPGPKLAAQEQKYGVRGKLVVSYFGAMGFANGLEPVLRAAQKCEEAQLPVHFILAGDGVERINLERLAKELQLSNLSFHQFQNRDGIRELMDVTDVVFVSYRPAAILETGSPNKFFDGLAAGKLILLNFKGWLLNEIIENKCGFFVNTTIPEATALFLRALLAGQKLKEFQHASRKLAEAKFSRHLLTESWIDIIKSNG